MSQSAELLPVPLNAPKRPSVAATRRDFGSAIGSYGCLGAALVTYLVSNGRWIVPVAAWIAPVFLIRFVRTQRPLWGLGLAFVGLTGVAFVSWWGLVPAPGVLYFVIVTTITAGQLTVAIDRLLCPRLDGVARTLVLPCAVVSCEFASFAISPYGTWGALGYTQFPNLPLMQLV